MKTDNELIAEFMGLTPTEKYYLKLGTWYDMKFHAYWDWLMPVVEKIESDPLMDVCIFKEATQIRKWDGSKEVFEWKILEPDGSSKIAHVYRAVVKTIHWYNEQKK